MKNNCLKGLNPEIKKIIFGFDAALLIGNSRRGTYKLAEARQ